MKTLVRSEYQVRRMALKTISFTTVYVEVDFNRVDSKLKKRVVSALKKGFILSSRGPARELFDLVAEAYSLPIVGVTRTLSTRHNKGCWYFKYPSYLKSKKMDELTTADATAVRMSDDTELKLEAQRFARYYTNTIENRIFWMLKDPKMLTAAFAEGIAPYRELIDEVVADINNGAVIRICN